MANRYPLILNASAGQLQELPVGDALDLGGEKVVGIGLGSAGVPSLSFNGDSDTGVYSPGANQLALATNGAQRLLIDSSGNITLSTANAKVLATKHGTGPVYSFAGDVGLGWGSFAGGLMSALVDNTQVAQIGSGGLRLMAGQLYTPSASSAAPSYSFDGDLDTGIFRPGEDTIAVSTGGSERLRITSDGKLGVGTSSPQATLHVKNTTEGDAYFKSNSGDGGADRGLVIKSGTGLYTGSKHIFDAVSGGGQLEFRTAGSSALFINQSQRVGVGTTSPTRALTVNGDMNLGASSKIESSSSGGTLQIQGGSTYPGGNILLGGGSGTDDIRFNTSGANVTSTERLRIDSSGRLLVGTTTAGSADADNLTIAGSGNTGITIRSGNTNPAAIYFADGTSGAQNYQGIIQYEHNSDSLSFYANYAGSSSPRMRIDSSGHVGIGTTSPDQALSVQGLISTKAPDGVTRGLVGSPSWDTSYFAVQNGTLAQSAANKALAQNSVGITSLNSAPGYPLLFEIGNSERARLDSSGRLLVGTSSVRSNFTNRTDVAPAIQIEGTASSLGNRALSIVSSSSVPSRGGHLYIAHQLSGTIGGNTLLGTNNEIGLISFNGNDGSEFVESATIAAFTDGTPGANDMPGRLVFSTTADGASSPTERMRIDSSGQVVITNPSNAYLNLTKTSEGNGSFQFDGSTFGITSNSSSASLTFGTASTERMRIDSSGRLGVGTSSPATEFEVSKSVDTEIRASESVSGNYVSLYQQAAVSYIIAGTASGTPTQDLLFYTGDSESVRIKSDGKLGVGTSSPSFNLDVLKSSAGTIARFQANGTDSNVSVKNNAREAIIGADTSQSYLLNTDAFPWTFWTNNLERVRIDSSGRVGVGSSAPWTNIEVRGSNVADGVDSRNSGTSPSNLHVGVSGFAQNTGGSISFGSDRDSGSNYCSYGSIAARRDSALSYVYSGYLTFSTSDGANLNEQMRLTSAGRLGIGTTSPGKLLALQDSSTPALGFYTGATLRAEVNATSAETSILSYANSPITFNIGGSAETEAVRIDSSGNVGIKTSAPSYTLDISSTDANALRIRGNNDNPLIMDATDSGPSYVSVHRAGTRVAYYGFGGSSNHFQIVNEISDGAITLSTSNTERFRIDTAGRLLVGTTTEGHENADNFTVADSGNCGITIRSGSSSGGNIFFSDATTGTGEYAGIVQYENSTDSMRFWTSSVEQMRIDSSGRLLVGTSSAVAPDGTNYPAFQVNRPQSSGLNASALIREVEASTSWPKLYINKNRANNPMQADNKLGSVDYYGDTGSSDKLGARIEATAEASWTTSSHPTRFVFSVTASGASSPTERMRIKSSGAVCINGIDESNYSQTTGDGQIGWNASESALALSHNNSSGFSPIYINKFNFTAGTSNNRFVNWYVNGGSIASITTDGSSVAYNTSSDYRLKENIYPLANASDRVKQLSPCRFNFIADPDKTVDGFLAHEAQAVVPECVTGTKDEVDDEGNPIYQGIDQSKLVPLLTAALQEAIAKIETLEAKVAALEAG